MSAAEWTRVKEAFGSVVELPEAERREALARLASSDPSLHREVEALLRAHREDGEESGPTVAVGERSGKGSANHEPGEMIGRYRLLERLGEGGFGVVYVAEQVEPIRRRVALKVVKAGMDTASVVARFEAERQALAVMEHPHIAKVLDAGATPSGRPYFVMELVKGRPINQYCDEAKLTIRERLELLVPVCRAVQHAHQKGIIHRDLKPSNVLVTLSDGRAEPKVIDFGIAKATAGGVLGGGVYTEFFQFLGTPEYMSPEQAAGSLDIDTRTDVYSLGVILYQLLTGSTPLDHQRVKSVAFDEVRRMIREEEPARPSTRLSAATRAGGEAAAARETKTRWKQVRGELDWIVMRALEKSPSRRYDSPDRLAEDLERYLEGQPIAAGPPTISYRVGKFVARRRGLVTGAVLMVLAAGVGVAGLGTGLVRASRERDDAVAAREREIEARTRADREARKYQAADEFMKHVLSNARPSGETGRPVTVSELLDEAAVRLDNGSLKSDPEVQATVRLSLAQSYRTVGDLVKARRHGELALQLSSGIEDGRNTGAAVALSELAMIACDVGENDRAVELSIRSIQMLKELGETRSVAYYNALQCQGTIRFAHREAAEGETLLRESVEVAGALFGERSAEAAQARAYLTSRMHSREGSETELRRIVDDYRAALGPNHPSVGDALVALGIHLHMTRKYDEAERAYGEALELWRRTLGPYHHSTFQALDFYGWVANSKGDYRAAVQRRREVIEVGEHCFGPESVRVGTAWNSLGLCAQASAETELSAQAFRRSVEIFAKAPQPEKTDYYVAMGNLALASWELRDFDEAERIARIVYQLPADKRPGAGGMYGRCTLLLGECLAVKGRYAEAETFMLEGYRLIEELRSASNRVGALFLASNSLAQLYAKWNEADPSAERQAGVARWTAKRDEWRSQVDWESNMMKRYKDRFLPR